eukprot:74936_1
MTASASEEHASEGSNVWVALGITTFAGFASFIGAFSIFCIKKEQTAVVPCSLAFAAGVTIYLSFVHLIPESAEQFYHATNNEPDSNNYILELLTLFCVIIGILLTFCMETLFHHKNSHNHNHSNLDSNTTTNIPENTATVITGMRIGDESQQFFTIATYESDTETQLSDSETDIDININTDTLKRTTSTIAVKASSPKPKPCKPTNYSHVSYSVAFALILHHFPEGIATFISLYHDLEFGLLVAFALALHDIPSGICISVPIYLSSGSKLKPFLLCFIAAIAYPIGGFIGWILIETTGDMFLDFFIATLFGITGGIMLYISFVELLPTAMITANKYTLTDIGRDKHAKPHRNVYTLSIVFLFSGFLVMAISNIFMNAVAGGHTH